MPYPLLVAFHLFAAIAFIGVVFFEVVVLGATRKKLNEKTQMELKMAITRRVRRFMPYVILVLFSSGLAMAYHHFPDPSTLFNQSLGVLLFIKMMLALSVFIHFCAAMYFAKTDTMTPKRFKFIHISVFSHQILIVVLAKSMFFIHW